ncbi:MAG: hypothetical protein ACJ8D5_01300 [Sphingomicrobium sp.]
MRIGHVPTTGARLATNAAQKTMSSRIRAIPTSFRDEGSGIDADRIADPARPG